MRKSLVVGYTIDSLGQGDVSNSRTEESNDVTALRYVHIQAHQSLLESQVTLVVNSQSAKHSILSGKYPLNCDVDR